VGQQKKKTKND